jgi:hypothetical protein
MVFYFWKILHHIDALEFRYAFKVKTQ